MNNNNVGNINVPNYIYVEKKCTISAYFYHYNVGVLKFIVEIPSQLSN